MEITQEQREQLINLNDIKVNEILGVKKLEVGKWYKCKNNSVDWLMLFNGKGTLSYGFNILEGYESYFLISDEEGDWKKATHEETENILIKEAKRRGLVSGVFVNSCNNNKFHLTDGQYVLTNMGFVFDDVVIFKNGKWAEIIDEKCKIKTQIQKLEEELEKLKEML